MAKVLRRSFRRKASAPVTLDRPRANAYHHAGMELLEPRFVLTAPTLGAIADVTLVAGAPLNIALNGTDADGDTLSFSASSNNGSVSTTVPTGNRSLRMNVAGFGEMDFQLFEDLAPRVTQHIIQLANSGFYNGVTFHRVIDNFVIQGGDPTGTGSGGSTLGDFDDQFNVSLQHTSTGILSMAKTTDDTNDSQFFITEGPQRHLDFQHSIFGFLTSGESVREAISETPVSNQKPVTPVTITSASVYTDTKNGVLRLSAPEGFTGQTDITVTVSDGNGGTAQRTFHVNVVADTVNGTPFLKDVPPVTTAINTTTTIQLQATDVEGDPVLFFKPVVSSTTPTSPPVTLNPNLQYSVSPAGLVTITPTNGIYGKFYVYVGVANTLSNTANGDTQLVEVDVQPPAPSMVDLSSGSDTGASNSDNITTLDNISGRTLNFTVAGTTSGAIVQLFSDSTLIGQATATGANTTITTNGFIPLTDGPHTIFATQTLSGVSSAASQSLALTIDDVNKPIFSSTPVLTATSGTAYGYNAQTNEEGSSGLVYSLPTAPLGMIINPSTGIVTWTPTGSQAGANPVVVRATDLGGNFEEQSFSINVNDPPLLNVIGAQQATVGVAFTKTITGVDVPGDTLTYSLDSGAPAGMSINPTTGEFTFTPTASQAGIPQNVTFRVTDSGGLSDTETVTFTVNAAPVLAPIANKEINESALLSFLASATDVNGGALTYSLEGAPTGAAINPTTGLFTWTPTEAQGPGNYTIGVRVTDSTGLSDLESFAVQVIEVSSPPTIATIGAKQVVENTLLSFSVSATDPDGDTVSYSLVSGAPAGAAIDATSGLFTWTPTSQQAPGVYNITVKVTDDGGISSTQSFSATVIDVNEAPTLGAIADQTVAEGTQLSLTATSADNNLPFDTLRYTLVNDVPAGAAIDATTGVLTWTPSEAQGPGTYTLSVRVTDQGGLADTKSFVVNVSEVDSAPVFSPVADQVLFQGQPLSLTVSAVDPDQPTSNPVTYSVVSGPAGLTVDPTSGLVSWSPAQSVVGTFNVTIKATEAGASGLSSTLTFGVGVGLETFGLQLTLDSIRTIGVIPPQILVTLQPIIAQAQQFVGGPTPTFNPLPGVNPLDRIQSDMPVRKPVDRDENVQPASGTSPIEEIITPDDRREQNQRSQNGHGRKPSGANSVEEQEAEALDEVYAQTDGDYNWVAEN